MTILVDQAVWPWRGRRWAHLVSDESYDELHAFAEGLGIPRRAFQGDHYDVPAEARDRAIELGAEAVDARVLVRRLKASGLRRAARAHPQPTLEVELVDPESQPATLCLTAYYRELDERFATGFTVDDALPLDPDEMRLPRGLFLVATYQGDSVGCGGLKLAGGAAAELKRLWVDPTARGFGVGRRLVAALEGQAVAHGYWKVRLDTNRTLTEAIALYRSLGYEEIEAFNDEQYAHHWFEKRLGDAP